MRKKGFTLIELLAVIAILAIIMLLVTPNILKMFNNAKKLSFKAQYQRVWKAVEEEIVNRRLDGETSLDFFCNFDVDSSEHVTDLDKLNTYALNNDAEILDATKTKYSTCENHGINSLNGKEIKYYATIYKKKIIKLIVLNSDYYISDISYNVSESDVMPRKQNTYVYVGDIIVNGVSIYKWDTDRNEIKKENRKNATYLKGAKISVLNNLVDLPDYINSGINLIHKQTLKTWNLWNIYGVASFPDSFTTSKQYTAEATFVPTSNPTFTKLSDYTFGFYIMYKNNSGKDPYHVFNKKHVSNTTLEGETVSKMSFFYSEDIWPITVLDVMVYETN